MESEALLFDLLLEENTFLIVDLFSVRKGPSIVVKRKEMSGEFSTLYESLRSDPDKFHEYTRMSASTFDYILEKIESRLRVPDTNFHSIFSFQSPYFYVEDGETAKFLVLLELQQLHLQTLAARSKHKLV
jgi:hypothetical protein